LLAAAEDELLAPCLRDAMLRDSPLAIRAKDGDLEFTEIFNDQRRLAPVVGSFPRC